MNATVFMTLDLEKLVEYGKAMVEQPPSEMDGQWAYNACKLSRQVIAQVEEERPSRDYVQKEVLDAFMVAFLARTESIEQTGRGGQWGAYLSHFVSNIRDRVVELKRYVREPPLVQIR